VQNGCDSTRTACLSETRRHPSYGRTLFPISSTSSLWHSLAFIPRSTPLWCRHAVLVESPFYTTFDLQLSFNRPLCYRSRDHWRLQQCLRTTSAILAGAHSYFVLSFKREGKNSYHDLISNPHMHILYIHVYIYTD
jgi:hypothetical protein